jgi:hypothetical protein
MAAVAAQHKPSKEKAKRRQKQQQQQHDKKVHFPQGESPQRAGGRPHTAAMGAASDGTARAPRAAVERRAAAPVRSPSDPPPLQQAPREEAAGGAESPREDAVSAPAQRPPSKQRSSSNGRSSGSAKRAIVQNPQSQREELQLKLAHQRQMMQQRRAAPVPAPGEQVPAKRAMLLEQDPDAPIDHTSEQSRTASDLDAIFSNSPTRAVAPPTVSARAPERGAFSAADSPMSPPLALIQPHMRSPHARAQPMPSLQQDSRRTTENDGFVGIGP